MLSHADILARRNHAVACGLLTAGPIFAARAENAELWGVEGTRDVSRMVRVGEGPRHGMGGTGD